MPRSLFLAWLCAILAAGACGGPAFRNGIYQDGETHYRVGLLAPDWRRVEIGSNDLAFHSGRLDAIIQANGSCNPSLDIPLTSLTNHLLIGFTERQVVSQETVPLADREALRTHVQAKLDGVPRELALYVLKKNGCVYDFALVAPPGPSFVEAREAFDNFVRDFQTGETR